jgi:hypothetical protein
MNKFLKASIGAMTCVVAIGCVQATLSDNSVCNTQPVSFPLPSLPAAPTGALCLSLPDVSFPPLTTTTTVDFSSDLAKVDDSGIVSQLSVVINQLLIDNPHGELNWVQSVQVMASTDTLPSALLATYTKPDAGASSELNVVVQMPTATVLQYLESGKVLLTITLNADTVSACAAQELATMGSSLNSNVEVCVAASLSINKQL